MKQEHEEYLYKVFPKIFPESIGIECDDGWFNIINHLCTNIQSHINWKAECPQVEIEQLKEKFGTMRFYYKGGDEYVSGLVAMAESMSGVTCEVCGDVGESTSSGWIKVLCPTHRAEVEARKKERLSKE